MGKQFELKVIGGYDFSVISSSLQKFVRRGVEKEAVFSAYLLHQSGYGDYCFRRLAQISSEDIGLAEPNAVLIVSSLYQMWQAAHKVNKEPSLNKFFYVAHCTLYLCRARKNREIDSLINLIDQEFQQGVRLEIPEYCIDPHCSLGKQKYGKFGSKDGRELERWNRWFEESSVVSNKVGNDSWETEFKQHIYKNAKELDAKFESVNK